MKNIYEVLRQKELELQQLQKDIEALRVAARLLADDNEAEPASSSRSMGTSVSAPRITTPAVATVGKPSDTMSPAQAIRQFP
jgi:hypothetical protein